ncbi:hypothetical protein ANME2D_00978 [Candidatus Methanoperedens nitroreducens]|uniref:UPF0147 protein ANME2D_00978 n=1 Tax=Candidatus Methanoperedens nitratireducens TaxID=1392998 RepID=A0A062VA03_9EURY|nr:UPF0147 family protein [Candidatus Methanoperedens nitroreducens]KCZ72549.1 hypothetical protein ANME2D_00978 [Candidatus Methanoperedens nitroreducens]
MSEKPTEIIKQCVNTLDRIINDDSVPRNIRRNADNMKNILINEKELPSIRAAMVISKLDEIGNDPNVPIHTRTLIWGLSSQLETIPVDR